MKTKFFAILLLGLFTLASCNNSDDFENNDDSMSTLLNVENDGTSTLAARANVLPVLDVTSPLTADEIEFLYAVREDEKMARDLYTSFSALYPEAMPISKILKAESSHIACIETVLSYYEIDYPALGEPGVFADATRQALYNELVAKNTTLLEAYSTMALVEEETISSYKTVYDKITNTNIALIVSNMIKASSNHLKAVVKQINNLGGSYTPSYLTTDEYNDIINSSFQPGEACGQHKGKGGNTNSEKGGYGKGHKGSVDHKGNCTGTSNGSSSCSPGSNNKGNVGKGYRGGR